MLKPVPLTEPFHRLTGRQLAILAASMVVVTILSIASWRWNVNPEIARLHPHWNFDGRMMYDGYGEYALHLRGLMVEGGKERWDWFRFFLETSPLADRPVFPALIALVDIPIDDAPTSGVIVATLCSILAWLMFARLAIEWFDLEGSELFGINLLYIFHVCIVTSWSRPMTEPLMLVFLIMLMRESALFGARPAFWRGVGIALLLAAGFFTKTIIIMATILPVAAFVATWANTKARLLNGLIIAALLPVALFALFMAALWFLGEDAAHLQFYMTAFQSLLTAGYGFRHFVMLGVALGVMAGIAMQVYPAFLLRPREGRVHRWSWREARWLLPTLWMTVYLIQRAIFFGVSLNHGRARYGVPIAPFILLIAYPGIQAFMRRYRWGWAAPYVLVAANLYVFGIFLFSTLMK